MQTEKCFARHVNKAFHGSPYCFEKFTTKKIGSGEGAQAYGWGLYFASREAVAQWYRESLTAGKAAVVTQSFSVDGTPFDEWAMKKGATQEQLADLEKALQYEVELNKMIAGLEFDMDTMVDELTGYSTSEYPEFMWELADIACEFSGRIGKTSHGHLYEVCIPADREMLDWDSPVAKQSANVKRALSCIGLSTFKSKLLPGGTGGDFYRRLAYGGGLEGVDIPSKRIGPKAASHFLYGIGIKGIKYLDRKSKKNGGGNYNYVIFQEDDIKIVGVQ